MDVQAPTPLLGGLSPAAFMRRHWQRQPLLVRQAWPGVTPPLPRAAAFALAARDDVESRLVRRVAGRWLVRQGPLPRRALPPLAAPHWTLLIQGLDLHLDAAHEMLSRFRFVPGARLDDLMLSWASAGGGVGPHVDSYDVFLLQVQGRRRWRVAPPGDARLRPGQPLRILARFKPTLQWVLEAGDMLYLPPLWGHDGTAVGGECMTCSVGFRAPAAGELAGELLQRLADTTAGDRALYADAGQAATARPAAVPPALQAFGERALARRLRDPAAVRRVLGEYLSEPKPQVWFEGGSALPVRAAVRLDRRTRMLYDESHLYVNGESLRIGGRDARGLSRLADQRMLSSRERAALSTEAQALLTQWAADGWLHAQAESKR